MTPIIAVGVARVLPEAECWHCGEPPTPGNHLCRVCAVALWERLTGKRFAGRPKAIERPRRRRNACHAAALGIL